MSHLYEALRHDVMRRGRRPLRKYSESGTPKHVGSRGCATPNVQRDTDHLPVGSAEASWLMVAVKQHRVNALPVLDLPTIALTLPSVFWQSLTDRRQQETASRGPFCPK